MHSTTSIYSVAKCKPLVPRQRFRDKKAKRNYIDRNSVLFCLAIFAIQLFTPELTRSNLDLVMALEKTDVEADGFLTIAQIAKQLGISRKCAYSLAKNGNIRSLQISPRLIRISRAEFSEWIQQRSRPT